MVGHSRARFVNARQCNTLGFCFGVGRELQDTHQRHVGLRSDARRAGHRFLKSPGGRALQKIYTLRFRDILGCGGRLDRIPDFGAGLSRKRSGLPGRALQQMDSNL